MEGPRQQNVAENLARLGMSTVLLSAVGGEEFGRQILERTAALIAWGTATPAIHKAAQRANGHTSAIDRC